MNRAIAAAIPFLYPIDLVLLELHFVILSVRGAQKEDGIIKVLLQSILILILLIAMYAPLECLVRKMVHRMKSLGVKIVLPVDIWM